MNMQDDQAEVLLLATQPYELLIRYQPVFEMITRKFARNGYYPFGDCSEMLQLVNEKICMHIWRISGRFDGRVLVRTYLSAICRNIIREHIRSSRHRVDLLRQNVAGESCFQLPVYAGIIFREEFKRLDKILFLMGPSRNKMLLTMKVVYRIPVSMGDFLAFDPEARDFVSESMIEILNRDAGLKDKDVYRLIMPLFSRGENQISHPDTIRKWFNYKTMDIIRLMNGSPPRASYAYDTLQILVEKYFASVSSGEYVPLYESLSDVLIKKLTVPDTLPLRDLFTYGEQKR